MRMLVVLAVAASCKDAPPKPRPLVTAELAEKPVAPVDAAPSWPAEKPDDGLAERPGPESDAVWVEQLARHVEGLASKLSGDVDCVTAAGHVVDALPEAVELGGEVHGLARAAAAGQLELYAKRIQAGFAQLKLVFSRCSTKPGFVATLAAYPFDPTHVTAPPAKAPVTPPSGQRPAAVTDEVIALAEQLVVVMDRMATGLAATRGDCASATAFLVAMTADRALGKLTKRFAELTTDPAVMTWIQENHFQKLLPVVEKMQSVLGKCMSDPAFAKAMENLAR